MNPMVKPFFIVVVIGTAIGWMMPAPQKRTPMPAPQPRSEAAAASTTASTATDTALETVLEQSGDGHYYVDALVNGQPVHFVVDTGASTIALTQDDARQAGIAFDPSQFEVIGKGASGDVRGQFVEIHHVAIGQKEAWDLRAVVLESGLGVSLLGQNYLSHVGSVAIANGRMTLR